MNIGVSPLEGFHVTWIPIYGVNINRIRAGATFAYIPRPFVLEPKSIKKLSVSA